MSELFSMNGKNAIVTGSTRGIGLAIADSFLDAGATVTICGRKQEGVDIALEELKGYGDRVLGVAAHVGEQDGREKLISSAEEKFGTVNVLVNNAGTNPFYGPIIDSEDWAWDKTFDINLKAPYILSRLLAKKMVASGSGGSIINISSIAGLMASENQGIYSVTKAGLIMLTRVMAREMGADSVRVNCICPGVIKTKLSEALWKDPKVEKSMSSLKALKRVGVPEEITGAAVYLASDASSFTTGSILQIDGGMVL